MRILVTGAAGMLGTDLVARLSGEHDVVPTDRADLDITDAAAITERLRDVDAVVNCAAWTAVDDAEEREPAAFALNAVAPQLLARAAARAGARLVQLSTDYVFDGSSSLPYPEDAPLAPRSAYGRTKAAGEWATLAADPRHLVVRTAWLYGRNGRCFPRTIGALALERDQLAVVTDEIGQPTWTVDVADLVTRLLEAQAPGGIYHATSSGRTSWFDFAREIATAVGRDPEMVTTTTAAAFARPAPRPSFSVLAHERLRQIGLEPIGPWQERWIEAAPQVLDEIRPVT